MQSSTPIDLRIWRLLVTTSVLLAAYFLRELIMPIAVAGLVAFVLSPAVTWLERRLGRAVSVALAVSITTVLIGAFAWSSALQIIDLAKQLPTYRTNLANKARALHGPGQAQFNRVSQMMADIERENEAASRDTATQASAAVPARPPLQVEVVEHRAQSPDKLFASASAIVAPLGSAAVVMILAIFMLLKRDDLRDRIIGLVGRGHIGATTVAMRDAAHRVNRFLLMNLATNVGYGAALSIGLYFIGVPSALLWGVVAAVLRFIPYVGTLIAMAGPIILSLAVFDGWTGPLLTIGLFIVLEGVIGNVVEPWLYGASTGVSSFALVIAALAWTWLWGPVGLVLSTPLTVCLLVMGKNVPQVAFLRTILSDESALSPHERAYHRLLAGDRQALAAIIEEQSVTASVPTIFGSTLLPALAMVEDDVQRRSIDKAQHEAVIAFLREVVDQMGHTPDATGSIPASSDILSKTSTRVLCIPVESAADGVAATMLAYVAHASGFAAEVLSERLAIGEVRLAAATNRPDWIWLCAVNPNGLARCRHLLSELRREDPDVRLSIGLWYAHEYLNEGMAALRNSGAEDVSTQFSESVFRFDGLRDSLRETFVPAPIPDNESARLGALVRSGLLEMGSDELFDRTTAELTKIFDVPIALVTLVDSGWQRFAAQCGLSPSLAEAGGSPRDVSVCGHVVAANQPLVIEDLAADRRFAGNPLLAEHALRFYAGVPLRTPDGMAVGSLCILDHRPRKVTAREIRLLQVLGENLMCEIESRITRPQATDTETAKAIVESRSEIDIR